MRENLPEVLPPLPDTIVPERPRRKVVKVGPIARELRAATEHMRTHGFTADYELRERACFIGTFDRIGDRKALAFFGELIFGDLNKGTGPWSGANRLRWEGWNTRDAVAALEMAADVAQAQGL